MLTEQKVEKLKNEIDSDDTICRLPICTNKSDPKKGGSDTHPFSGWPGANVMIFKIPSPKKIAKSGVFDSKHC
jgi:hypothetical protein